MKRTSIKIILFITIFMNTLCAWCMEEESTYVSLVRFISDKVYKKFDKEFFKEKYLNQTTSQDIYKELNERIKQGNLKNSKSDDRLYKLQKSIAWRSWAAQMVIAEALQEGNTRKIIALAKKHKDAIPSISMLLIEQIRTEELAETQEYKKELSEFIFFDEQPETPSNAKKD